MAEEKKPYHEQVAERLIEQLRQGTAPWQRPWKPGMPNQFMPMNPTSGKRYKGINAVHLLSQGYSDPRWLTYKQAVAAGAQVRRGEKGTGVQYWKFKEERQKLDGAGKPLTDAQGNVVMEVVQLERPKVFFATVFNAEQIDGMPPLPTRDETQHWDPIPRAEAIMQASGAQIRHHAGDGAYYAPAIDAIHMPNRERFHDAAGYYATALHELGHWTGHETRLARDLSNPFGSEGYAREELRAEIASMILGDELGIGHDPGQHAAYVGSWIKALQEDPYEVFRAAADAERIKDFVLSLEQQQEQTEEIQAAEVAMADVQQSYEEMLRQVEASMTTERVEAIRRVASRLVDVRDGKIDSAAFEAGVVEALGVPLPADWDGRIVLQPSAHEVVDGVQTIVPAHENPSFYGVFVRHAHGEYAEAGTFKALANAEALQADLQLIDALAESNVVERATKVAHVRELQVLANPNSTEAERIEAKSVRKTAEAAAMLQEAKEARTAADQAAPAAARTQAPRAPQPATNAGADRIWLDLPYAQKEAAKSIAGSLEDGSRAIEFDRDAKRWFARPGADLTKLQPWLPGVSKPQVLAAEKTWLAVPFEQRGAAKSAAGNLADGRSAIDFDREKKCWYARPGADLGLLKAWLPTQETVRQEPAQSPEDEFANVLRDMGCVLDRDPKVRHPIMDGSKQRIALADDKAGEKSVFYVAHLDGRPAGYIKNNKTGDELKWKSKGYTLSDAAKAELQAGAAKKTADREADLVKQHEQAADLVTKQLAKLTPITGATPYLQTKDCRVNTDVFTDKDGQTTFIPAYDAAGKIWTTQYINAEGVKRFAKGGRKDGCFHVVGGFDALAKAPAIVLSEGYATADEVSRAVGFATVAAFDSGNLEAVAKALHARFPDKPFVIAGDDDTAQKANPGRTKALAAAEAVGGAAVFPVFAPGEQSAMPKQFTDFNDLATKSQLGREAVERQVKAVVDRAIEKRQHREHVVDQQLERTQNQVQKSRGARL
jgi:antirestriction protein ArdC/phage/plasmid primase-like uncharacterized protein